MTTLIALVVAWLVVGGYVCFLLLDSSSPPPLNRRWLTVLLICGPVGWYFLGITAYLQDSELDILNRIRSWLNKDQP